MVSDSNTFAYKGYEIAVQKKCFFVSRMRDFSLHGNDDTIRIGWEIQCFLYAGFFKTNFWSLSVYVLLSMGPYPSVFFHAPNLFVWLKEAPKHLWCSFLTPYIPSFQSDLTLLISPLTSWSSKKFWLFLVGAFTFKIIQNIYKIVSCHTQPPNQ